MGELVDRPRIVEIVLAVAETVLGLLACIFLSLLLTLPWMPDDVGPEFSVNSLGIEVIVWGIAVQSIVFLLVGWYMRSRSENSRSRVIETPPDRLDVEPPDDRGAPSSGSPLPPRRFRAAAALATGVGSGLAAFVVSIAIALVMAWVGWSPREQDWIVDLLARREHLVLIWPLFVLLAPLAEEVFFRGYVLRRIAGPGGVAAGLAVSSVLFALVHFNASGLLVYLAVGLVFGLVYLRTASLVAPVTAHVTYNGLVLSLVLLA